MSDEMIDTVRFDDDSLTTIKNIFPRMNFSDGSSNLNYIFVDIHRIKAFNGFISDSFQYQKLDIPNRIPLEPTNKDISLIDFLNLYPRSLSDGELKFQRAIKKMVYQEYTFEETYRCIDSQAAFKGACMEWFKLHNPKNETDLNTIKNTIKFNYNTQHTLDTGLAPMTFEMHLHRTKFDRYLQSAVDDYKNTVLKLHEKKERPTN